MNELYEIEAALELQLRLERLRVVTFTAVEEVQRKYREQVDEVILNNELSYEEKQREHDRAYVAARQEMKAIRGAQQGRSFCEDSLPFLQFRYGRPEETARAGYLSSAASSTSRTLPYIAPLGGRARP
jgi:hypothetical protein